MGIRQAQTTIGDHTYEVSTLGSEKGTEVFARLFQILAPAFATAMSLGGETLLDADIKAMAVAVKELAAREVPRELSYFVKAFLPTIQWDGGTDGAFVSLAKVYEVHFSGKIHELLQLVWFCCEVNYEGFLDTFKRAAVAARAAKEVAAKASPSPSPST